MSARRAEFEGWITKATKSWPELEVAGATCLPKPDDWDVFLLYAAHRVDPIALAFYYCPRAGELACFLVAQELRPDSPPPAKPWTNYQRLLMESQKDGFIPLRRSDWGGGYEQWTMNIVTELIDNWPILREMVKKRAT